MTYARKLALSAALAVVVAGVPLVAGVKVKVDYDKTFDFRGLTSYAWRLDGVQPVKILQNTEDKPEEVRRNLEPLILEAVDRDLAKKGFKRVATETPDLYADYYLLIGPGVSSQYHGQFVGAVPAWGLPDFRMSTSALKIFEQGSLIIDVVSPVQKQTVWRGSADTEIDRRRTKEERAAIIGEAVAKMFEKFPPKSKKH
jgi:hypothetical protein